MKTALVVGATGLIGRHCVEQLLQQQAYSKIVVIARRSLQIKHEKLDEEVIDFSQLDSHKDKIQGDDFFCCMGTTIKKAGSQKKFRLVDFDYPYQMAKIAKENGTKQFLLVTSLGANSRSPFFYNRVKGDIEKAIMELSFTTTHILRPSLLLGQREEKRFWEEVGTPVFLLCAKLMLGPMQKYRAIYGEVVARVMIKKALENIEGVHYYESNEIQNIYNLCK